MSMADNRIEPLGASRSLGQAFPVRKRNGVIVRPVRDEDRRLQLPHLLDVIKPEADKIACRSPEKPMLCLIWEGGEGSRGKKHSAGPAGNEFRRYGASHRLSNNNDIPWRNL